VVVGAVVVGVVGGVGVVTVVGGRGGGAGVVVAGGESPFVVVGPVVAVVLEEMDAGTADVDVDRCDRVDVASPRVGTAGADECEPAMMTAARSPPAARNVPASA